MKQNLPDIYGVINFVVLVGGLVFLLRKRVSSFLHDRSRTIEENLRESEELRNQALKMLTAYQEKVSSLDSEIEKMLKKAQEDGELEKEKILARAEMLAQQIVDNAKRSAEREADHIRRRIEKQFMQKALEQAKNQITEKASQSEHQVFVDHFLAQMEQKHGVN